MLDGFAPDPIPRRPLLGPDFQLPAFRVFWRIAVAVLVVREYLVWRYVSKFVPADEPLRRIGGFLYFSPKAIYISLLVASIAAIVLSVGFRLLARPIMARWYLPRSLDPCYTNPLPFHVLPGERPISTTPARLIDGHARPCGELVVTTGRVHFFPFAWDGTAWDAPLRELQIGTEPTVRRVLGIVIGYPDHLAFRTADGRVTRVVVARPDEVMADIAAGRANLA